MENYVRVVKKLNSKFRMNDLEMILDSKFQGRKLNLIRNFIRYLSCKSDFITSSREYSQNKQHSSKIVIVGAGISGLSAADHLIRNGYTNLTILDACNRYGGRMHTVQFGDAICELGAKWLGLTDNPFCVHKLANKAGPIASKESLCSWVEYPFVNSNGNVLNRALAELTITIFKCMIEHSDQYLQNDKSSENISIKEYFENEIKFCLEVLKDANHVVMRQIFDSLLRSLSNTFGCDLSYVNIKQLALRSKMFASPFSLSGGMKEILSELTRNINPNQLILDRPIQKINWASKDNDHIANVMCIDGSKHNADHIITTLPLGVLKAFSSVFFSPPLPRWKIDAISKLGCDTPGRLYMEFEKPINSWLKNPMRLVWSAEELSNRSDWTTGISEICLVPNSDRVIEMKLSGESNEIVEQCKNESHIIEGATNALKKFVKKEAIPRPIRILCSSWLSDPRFLGGIAYLTVKSGIEDVENLASPLGHSENSILPTLLFAGDATSWDGFGCMHGARLSAIREAERIIKFHKNT